MLCDDGEIDLELFKYITDSPRIKDIPSRIKNKYCYVINSELIKEMNMFFSSQSMLGYTEKTKSKYDSLIKLISNEDIKLSECEPYNIASLNWLIEKGSIYIEDNVINYNKERVFILHEFYEKEVISFSSSFCLKDFGVSDFTNSANTSPRPLDATNFFSFSIWSVRVAVFFSKANIFFSYFSNK